MSNSESEKSEKTDEPTEGIHDEELPEDLQPTDDNPLAEPLAEDEVDADDLDLGTARRPPGEDDDEEPRTESRYGRRPPVPGAA